MRYRQGVDAASSQTGELALSLQTEPSVAAHLGSGISPAVLTELWLQADGTTAGLSREEFEAALTVVGTRFNHGLPAGTFATLTEKTAFFRALRLPELALAHACALGRDAAWERFVASYRAPLTQAAIAITGSAKQGHDLADALYGELYGLRERAGERVSPLLSYSGRGSLLGWLRTTLAQRHVDHHRRTRRETPLEDIDVVAPNAAAEAPETAALSRATQHTLHKLAAEDRFLLSAYFLDRRTLLELSRTLQVHEATVSRRLKRLTADLRKQLLRHLQAGGLSRRAAEEALGADPRDVEINLRQLLQTSQPAAFQDQTHRADSQTLA